MAELKIKYADLVTAIQLSKEISTELEKSCETADKLKSYLISAKWSGQTKRTFSEYLSLITQYHEDLIDIMKEHKKAVENLKERVDSYNNSSEVSSIKGL